MRINTGFLRATALAAMFALPAVAQDFEREYVLRAGGEISIRNVAGRITVTGYDGATVIVTAFKQGRDRDRVAIVDASDEDGIRVYAEYPGWGRTDARVEFLVLAPRSVEYDYEEISSVSDDVDITGVAGKVRAQSVSGDVELKEVFGTATAGSVAGDVYVQLPPLLESVNMKFSSVAGDVVVEAPIDLDADVVLSTISGSLRTDFPLRITGRWPFSGRIARGRVGDGNASLRVSSVSGRVSLLVLH